MCNVKHQQITDDQREKAVAILMAYVRDMKAWHRIWEAFHDDMGRLFPIDGVDADERYWDGLNDYAENITHGYATFNQQRFETELRHDIISHALGGSRWELSRQKEAE